MVFFKEIFSHVALVLFCFLLSEGTSGQTRTITGTLVDAQTNQPVPYALISTPDHSNGTLSNEDGLFILILKIHVDSLIIESIGYQSSKIFIRNNIELGVISLKPEIALLSEVNIKPEDDHYLFEILEECRSNAPTEQTNARAYLELKSFDGNGQIELLESYHNVLLHGYEINDLILKTGRVALRKRDGNFFLSMESTRAIAMMRVLKSASFFPDYPLALPIKQAKKKFRLYRKGVYKDENEHELMLISFRPKQECSTCFEGKMIIDVTDRTLRQINYTCTNCAEYPFVPVFPDDELENVSMNITKKFDEDGRVQQVNFRYGVHYISRKGKENENNFDVETQAILHIYQYEHPFFTPQFHFPERLNDYKKLAAIPDQPDFWKYRNELRLDANVAENERFYSSDSSITNHELFNGNSELHEKLLRYHYVPWSERRILMGGVVDDTITQIPTHVPIAERYKLTAQILLDVINVHDSIVITTKAIFDPYQSYYYLPQDSVTNAFVNLYFDLVEVQRRKLEADLNATSMDEKEILLHYEAFMKEHVTTMDRFLRAVDRGTQKEKMKEWNDMVKAQTHIDNLKLFNVYQ